MRCIFIHRRDLRYNDNTALINACNDHDRVYPIFIFTPEQVKDNEYKSDNAVQFMVESLLELNKTAFFYGDVIKVLRKLITENDIDAVYVNEDYTPYSKKRDKLIKELCDTMEIQFSSFTDLLLQPDNLKKDGTPYLVFTPFYRNAAKKRVDKVNNKRLTLTKMRGGLTDTALKKYYKKNPNIAIRGGRNNALKILNNLDDHKKYNKTRNIPSIETTHLSPHLKFGTVSVREVYHKMRSKLNSGNDLIKQLYWRDFYMTILNTYDDLKKSNTRDDMNTIRWSRSKSKLDAWKNGMTGFPIVDAGMRQLNTTGFMHNRVRMITATFLIYNLHIHWREGEKYFSQMLIDSDIANNNGNWKWIAGIETYSNEYFKAMSVVSQAERFDEDAEYIKKWIPELEDIESSDLLDWEENHEEYDVDYPSPIVDSKSTRKIMIEKIKKAIK